MFERGSSFTGTALISIDVFPHMLCKSLKDRLAGRFSGSSLAPSGTFASS